MNRTHSDSPNKAGQRTAADSCHADTPGQQSIAAVPPNYGIDLIDHSAAADALLSGDQQNQTGIATPLLHKMEDFFQRDFSVVRLRKESPKASAIGAVAYTQGHEIVVAPGRYRPDTTEGQQLLGHELAHVMQQSRGLVRATAETNGMAINNDSSLEREADVLGERAALSSPMSHERALGSSTGRPQPFLPIQRLVETGIQQLDVNVMIDKTIGELVDHANRQADWYMHITAPDLVEFGKEFFGLVLRFTRQHPVFAGASSHFVLRDFWKQIAPTKPAIIVPAEAKALDAYGRAVESGVLNRPASDLDQARKVGKAVVRLEDGGLPLNSQKRLIDAGSLWELINKSQVDNFINYVQPRKGWLGAPPGVEARSFLTLCDGGDPKRYDDKLGPWVKNVHRFQPQALDIMVNNVADTSRKRPLVVILHSVYDYNGAFHQNPNITELMKRNALNVILVEGGKTLSEAGNRLTQAAETFGQKDSSGKGRIAQLVFVGHGEARSMQLSGDPFGAEARIDLEGGNFDDKVVETLGLFDSLLKAVVQEGGEQARVVFAACLTNSSLPPNVPLSTISEIAAGQIRDHLNQTPSLVKRLQQFAGASVNLDVRGANAMARMSKLRIVSETENKLELSEPQDPKLMSADKLEYVTEGDEPLGVMRAAVESWSEDQDRTVKVMRARVGKETGATWNSMLIGSLFEFAANKGKDANRLVRLASVPKWAVQWPDYSLCRPAKLENGLAASGLEASERKQLLARFPATDKWKNWWVPIAGLQPWARLESSKYPDLKNSVAVAACAQMREFVDFALIDTTQVLPTDNTPPDPGQLRLALLGAVQSDNPSIDYLKRWLPDETRFPDPQKARDALGGLAPLDSIYSRMGRETIAASPTVEANLQSGKPGFNTKYVRPLSRRGRVKSDFEPYKAGDVIEVSGETDTDYAVWSVTTNTSFIRKEAVELIDESWF